MKTASASKAFLVGSCVIFALAAMAQPVNKTAVLTVAPLEQLKEKMGTSLRSTKPDFMVFVPTISAAGVSDTGNEHFLVFDGPDKSLMAVWTQSSHEGQPDQHIVFSRSEDEGGTWTSPRVIAGPTAAGEGLIASWAFPMVSRSGRIYVLYSQHVGKFDTFFHTTGRMDGICSDDNGQTWSKPQTISMPRTMRDNPDESFPANWICWQKPLRLAKDGSLSRWVHPLDQQGGEEESHLVLDFTRFGRRVHAL